MHDETTGPDSLPTDAPGSPGDRTSSEAIPRERLAWLGLLIFLTFGYFQPRPAWNQHSRFALTRALVESRGVTIDRFHGLTGDKSFRDGHFYSDKAPGVSLLAALPYAAIRVATLGRLEPVVQVRALDPSIEDGSIAVADKQAGDRLIENGAFRIAIGLSTWLSVGAICTLGALAFWWLMRRRLRLDERQATLATLLYTFGTIYFPYATSLYGHGLAAAFLVIALYCLESARPADSDTAFDRKLFLGGAALGAAVMTEYTIGPVAILFAIIALPTWGKRSLWLFGGGVPFAVVLALYHLAAFGHVFSTGYDFVYLPAFAEGMRVRYGIGAFDPSAAYRLIFGSYRGLFVMCPIAILAVPGLVILRRDSDLRGRWIVALWLTVAYFIWLNASYYMWDGGSAAGPRHLLPMLGLLMLGIGWAIRVAPAAVWVIGGVSVAQMLIVTTGEIETPRWGSPLWEHAWGSMLALPGGEPWHNLGATIGLPSIWSLVPLAVIWWIIVPLTTAVAGNARTAQLRRLGGGQRSA